MEVHSVVGQDFRREVDKFIDNCAPTNKWKTDWV